MTDPDYRRDLARIEGKVDHVETAIVNLARMEECMVTLFKRMDNYDAALRTTEGRIAEMERITLGRGVFFRWLDRGSVAILGQGWHSCSSSGGERECVRRTMHERQNVHCPPEHRPPPRRPRRA